MLREKQPFRVGPTSFPLKYQNVCHIGLVRFVISGNDGQERISGIENVMALYRSFEWLVFPGERLSS